MSFITKRERVFNEYDLYELPPRNEGKLKAYASCTDARAWSHFCADKSEHLVEVIKRNNEVCRPKYVPTEAIVNTLLAHKQAEIGRLKRKIEEFEQMVAAYDELELSCEQKCEIAKAHATIKEANKDLNELWFDLDLSGYTGIDSEDFETGKSRGDEPSRVKSGLEEDGVNELGRETPRSQRSKESKGVEEWISEKELPLKESKGNQAVEVKCICDASTNVVDPRIQELTEVIIAKDAKLGAMRNTYAVIENDACEPYCIYAHIYTALEKIFGILCQNDKYKLYLNLMTAGKDIRGIDIKGRILFKLKVLEKFSLALLAPCSRDIQDTQSEPECSCYRAEIVPNIEKAYAITSSETQKPLIDNKRAQLVADIMENDEMKELLNRDMKPETDDEDIADNYNIDQENLKRLKSLQQNYEDLMNCYESLKHEKECMQIRCRNYEKMENDFQNLQMQLREYNSLWNEKEHYRKRSQDLDALKEQYLVLCDETTNLETELKAENEINDVKNKTIEELRGDNIDLERRLNEASIAFEKERNCVQCKLKESECKIMCQGQQIKSLSIQIDRLLEQDPDKPQPKQSEAAAIALIDEMNALKEQIKNLQDALFCNEEENQQLQLEYQNKLNLINDLKMEIEDWKGNYEKTLQRNDYLEKYTNSFRDEIDKLLEENKALTQDVEEKQHAIDNLINVLNNKSQEIDKLMQEMEIKSKENGDLFTEIRSLHDSYSKSITALNTEKSNAMQSLQIAKTESRELLDKVKDYDKLVDKQEDISNLYKMQIEECNRLKTLLNSTQQENQSLQMDLGIRDNNNSILLQEIQRLQEVNSFAVNNISALQEEKKHYKISLELTKKDSKVLEDRLQNLEDLSYKFQQLKESHEKLIREKYRLENELAEKSSELDNAIHAITLTKKDSEELETKLQYTEHLKVDLESADNAYKQLLKDQQCLKTELDEKKREFDSLSESYKKMKNNLKRIGDESSEEIKLLSRELADLKKCYNKLLIERNALKNDFDEKNDEINDLYNSLEEKIDENKELSEQLQLLALNNSTIQGNINTLQQEHLSTTSNLDTLRKESEELMDRVRYYESLESKFKQLKKDHEHMKGENHKLQNELDLQKIKNKKIAEDNEALESESQHLLSHSEVLEKALINARTELISQTSSPINIQMDIKKQIEEMKREKNSNALKIRDLYNKLDASDNIITDLTEKILARDDRIAILENHINELQDEVERLQRSLAEMVDTGEQIKDISHQKIAESLETMEAHHSKATHNMKMELAKLQGDKIKLEERLSISKIKTEDSARDKNKYISQIIHLQNEREIIVTEIKQLELKSVGDSALSPEQCGVKDILDSLERIRQYVDARSSKSTSLEQTLLKVQTSYQVVQSKADEAKKIVEKEKYKIINEKEEAIKDRINMEKQLKDLKEQLENQISLDRNVIKDLEAEILNQKLICDKLNTTTQLYVSKLNEEMQSLQELYEKSLKSISDLEKRLLLMSDDNDTHLGIIEKVNKNLQEKINEISILKIELDTFKNKPIQSLGTQASLVKNRDEETQTYEEFLYEGYDNYEDSDKIKNKEESDFNAVHAEKSVELERKAGHITQPNQKSELQVLVANVEPTFDYVRNSYLNYKLKNLKLGRVELHSISCSSENDTELDIKEISDPEIDRSGEDFTNSQSNENMNVIDIYNKESIHTNSSKNINSNYPENEKAPRSPGIISAATDFGLPNERFDTKNSTHIASNLFGSVSGISTDKDLFVIYKDSETNKYDKKSWSHKKRSNALNETVTVNEDKDDVKNKLKQYDVDNDTYSYVEDEELIEDDSVKDKLKINVPRVETDSPTMDIFSDYEKKSLDSYNIKNSMSNDETKLMESYASTENEKLIRIANKKQRLNKTNVDHIIDPNMSAIKKNQKENSHHRLSRTDADVRLIRKKPGHTMKKHIADDKSSNDGKPTSNFNLDYIHTTPDNTNAHEAVALLRKTRSHDMLDPATYRGKNESRLSETDNASTDYKTASPNDKITYIICTKQKKYTDQEVLVKLDAINEYEIQIKNLTNTLANIEKDYKKKIEAIKVQYDSNIKSILNEHNLGVKSIQGLHEETLQDIVKHHENEVENLRSMSIDAMRKADRLEKEVRSLKYKIPICSSTCLNEEPFKISTPDLSKHRQSRIDTKTLTKTNVEAFNVRPKSRSNGPCTCSLDINISDTIRNIFEQVDVDQRKIAEQTYLKYIANKILNSTVEALDCQELSFLHLKVCRIWKVKLSKEETLQRRISSLEAEVIHKQRHNQYNMAELDRQVAEERRRLQEVREAVCRNVPTASRYSGLESPVPTVLSNVADLDRLCGCNIGLTGSLNINTDERQSAGDLGPNPLPSTGQTVLRQKRAKPDSNRAVLAKLDAEERREKKLYNDEPPTRLRRPHDRHAPRSAKK